MGTKLSQASKDSMRAKKASTKAAKTPARKKATPRNKKPIFKPETADLQPLVFNIPSSFKEVTLFVGGPHKVFNVLRLGIGSKVNSDPDNEEFRLRGLLDEWDNIGEAEQEKVNVDKLIEKHGLTAARVFGMFAEDAYAMTEARINLIRGLGDAEMLEASIKHSLKPILGQQERMEHLRRKGELPTTQKAQIINVNANASSVSQSAAISVQRGLPSFESAMNEDHLNAIDILSHEENVEGLEERLSDKPLELGEGSKFSIEELDAISEEVER